MAKICSICKNEKELAKGRLFCKDCKNQYERNYRQNNKDKFKEYRKKYYPKNKENKIKYNKKYNKMKRLTDINFKIKENLRTRLNMALKNNSKIGSAVKDLGCTIQELKMYLENKFKLKMTWDNHRH